MKKTPKALVLYKQEPSYSRFKQEHRKTLLEIEKVLLRHKISYKKIPRHQLKRMGDEDLIITVGGDGTFLHASHFIKPSHLLLGVNSVPSASHGAFCYADRNNFEKVILKILKKKPPLSTLYRLKLKINRREIPIRALNDILFSHPSPAGTSRYFLKIGNKGEEQKSSGIWISTAAGSTAAIRSAGGKLLSKQSTEFQFVVREPFVKKGKTLKIKKGILFQKQKIVLIAHMSQGSVFIDGAHLEYPLNYGDRVEIQLAKEVIRVVMK